MIFLISLKIQYENTNNKTTNKMPQNTVKPFSAGVLTPFFCRNDRPLHNGVKYYICTGRYVCMCNSWLCCSHCDHTLNVDEL